MKLIGKQKSPWAYHGADKPDVLIAGHSNSRCLKEFILLNCNYNGVSFGAIRPSNSSNKFARADENYWQMVANSDSRYVCISWDGSQPFTQFLFEPNMAIYPNTSEHGSTAHPTGLIKAFFRDNLLALQNQITSLKENGSPEIILLGTPPPKSDDLVKQGLSKEDFFLEKMKELNLDRDSALLTPMQTRIGLWELLQSCMKEIADFNRLTFISFPKETMTVENVLLPEFSADDVIHSNSSAALAVIEKVSNHIRGLDGK